MKFFKKFKDSFFIIFLSVSLLMIIFYFIMRLFFRTAFDAHINLMHDLFAISLAILSPGVFVAILKYFQFLGVFETEINKIIRSSSFEATLQKAINHTVYSVEFLSQQKDLEKIWRNSTICLFKSYFPHISDKVEEKLTNELFKNSNLSHYYRNYQIRLSVELLDDTHLQFVEYSQYTIVRPNQEEFTFEFTYSIPNVVVDAKNKLSVDSVKINKKVSKSIDIVENPLTDKIKDVTYKYQTNGAIEYEIDHKVTLIYPIDIDNEYTFHSQRILEDLTAELKVDNKLSCIFVPMNNISMDLRTIGDTKIHSYRGIQLPNSGFRTYYSRKK